MNTTSAACYSAKSPRPAPPLAGTNEFSYTADYHPATKKYVDSGDSARISTFAYDGFNRLARVTDPMGNQMVCFFDANDNLKDRPLFRRNQ